jgi:hypothetical protein
MLTLLRLPRDRRSMREFPQSRLQRRYADGSDMLIVFLFLAGASAPYRASLGLPTLIGGGLVRCRAQMRPNGLSKTCTGAVGLGRSGPSREIDAHRVADAPAPLRIDFP